MPDYDNSQRGVLFKNDKRTTEQHPMYKGNGEINGVEVWISAWVKTSKAGASYMSLSFENKEGQVVAHGVTPAAANDFATPIPDDSDIPF